MFFLIDSIIDDNVLVSVFAQNDGMNIDKKIKTIKLEKKHIISSVLCISIYFGPFTYKYDKYA